jgi:predicted N-formylglutamate amidohydrolase
VPAFSENTRIPGNIEITPSALFARSQAIFKPYHSHIHDVLDRRDAEGRRTILVFVHSMTNVYNGQHRPMHAAVLYGRDPRFSLALLKHLRRDSAVVVCENEPYAVTDETDYSVGHHAESRGLLYAELEIRQDLITHPSGQDEWAARLADSLNEAGASCVT